MTERLCQLPAFETHSDDRFQAAHLQVMFKSFISTVSHELKSNIGSLANKLIFTNYCRVIFW